MCIRLLVSQCAETSLSNKNPLLHPIYVSLSSKLAMQEVAKLLKDSFDEMEVQEDYYEIFVRDGTYGVTLSFTTQEGGTLISAYVYNKRHRYHKKKYLIKFLLPLREKFKDSIKDF